MPLLVTSKLCCLRPRWYLVSLLSSLQGPCIVVTTNCIWWWTAKVYCAYAPSVVKKIDSRLLMTLSCLPVPISHVIVILCQFLGLRFPSAEKGLSVSTDAKLEALDIWSCLYLIHRCHLSGNRITCYLLFSRGVVMAVCHVCFSQPCLLFRLKVQQARVLASAVHLCRYRSQEKWKEKRRKGKIERGEKERSKAIRTPQIAIKEWENFRDYQTLTLLPGHFSSSVLIFEWNLNWHFPYLINNTWPASTWCKEIPTLIAYPS